MKITDEELAELGIKRTAAPGRGRKSTTAYIIKCTRCGREVVRLQLIMSKPVYCNICKRGVKEKMNVAKRIEQQDARMLESMCDIDHVCEDRFYNASQIVRRVGNCEQAIIDAYSYAAKFDSVPEAVTAIILLSCDIHIVPQAKIFNDNRRSVDFMLPDHKAIIEVDGALYHTNKEEQYWRDEEIKGILGDDWIVLHLPADDIAKKPKVFKALIKEKFCKLHK